MATAKLKAKKTTAAKKKLPAVKRAYRRRVTKGILLPAEVQEILKDAPSVPAEVDEVSDLRVQLLHEKAEHAQTRSRLAAAEGCMHQLQHQLDAVRHTVSRTVVLRDGQMAQNLEFSPLRTLPERLPSST